MIRRDNQTPDVRREITRGIVNCDLSINWQRCGYCERYCDTLSAVWITVILLNTQRGRLDDAADWVGDIAEPVGGS